MINLQIVLKNNTYYIPEKIQSLIVSQNSLIIFLLTILKTKLIYKSIISPKR